MKIYKKPMIVYGNTAEGLFPAALGIVGLSAAKMLAVGAAAGLAVGVAKGDGRINSNNTSALTARKNFALA